ncbi:tyrosine-protein phosphatase [Arthrobacter cheniae]|uniref:Tyrosine-protein phosphatase n=1 Tax=Arthrobacter cheniae TaxID=1258888 RepID=A0A3A5LY44_9MICC|nr:tyrosine-protein phosphatase [Arthrobacter cheniae]RJT75650.1 tyrosine-protein phosphatase [Arthrobacter cheniae]
MRLRWEGLVNARDLGGIALQGGGQTRRGAYARSDHPLNLTPTGWGELQNYGVRTIASLETGGLEGEEVIRSNRPVVPPADVTATVLRIPVEDATDASFMARWACTGLWGTPLYFSEALINWPAMYGAAINALAQAEGPVLMHCGRGHDRTGIMALLLLTIAGATVEGITEDYLLSARNLESREPRSVELLEGALRQAGVRANEAIGTAIDVVDDAWLSRAKVTEGSVSSIRAGLAV